MTDSYNYTAEFLAGHAAGHYDDQDLLDLQRSPIPEDCRLQRLTTWSEIMSYSANTEVVIAERTFWWGRLSDCDVYRACVLEQDLPQEDQYADVPPGTAIPLDLKAKVFVKDSVPSGWVPLYPSCPRGMQLVKMPLHIFLLGVSSNLEPFKHHGWSALLAAYHGNCVHKESKPWCHQQWVHYCVMLDRGCPEWDDVEDITGPVGLCHE